MQEHASVFGKTSQLFGVVTDPVRDSASKADGRRAVILLNAGVIHRVGPSRLYVALARRMAASGWTAVRFDHSGIGDSPARRDGLPFEQSAITETREVMDSLQRERGIDRFVLMGLCSGAVTALKSAAADPRVTGAVLINPQGFDASPQWHRYVQVRGDARRYWTRSLFSADSWARALTGRVGYRRLLDVLWRQATSPAAEVPEAVTSVSDRVGTILRGLLTRKVRLLFLCSEGDDGIDYMNVILGQNIRHLQGGEYLDVRVLAGADHSLTLQNSQRQLIDEVLDWSKAPREADASELALISV